MTAADDGVTAYAYDLMDRMIRQVDPRGSETSYRYNAFGELSGTTDAYGMMETYRYDLAGNLVSSTDKRGSTTYYRYDANRRLVETRAPLRKDDNGDIVYAVESYAYDEAGNLVRSTLTDTSDDEFMRVVHYSYYENGLLHTESDSSGAYTEYAYDRNGNLTATKVLRDSPDVYDITRYEYDSMNRLIREILLVEEDALSDEYGQTELDRMRDAEYSGHIQLITEYAYDRLGNKIKETNALGHARTYEYDRLNRLVVTRDAEGVVIEKRVYDANGNVIKNMDARGVLSASDDESRYG